MITVEDIESASILVRIGAMSRADYADLTLRYAIQEQSENPLMAMCKSRLRKQVFITSTAKE